MIIDDFFENNSITAERITLSSNIDIDVNNLKPIKANFYIPILTPTLNFDDGEYDRIVTPRDRANIHGANLNTKSFIQSNYIELEIPVYIQEQFISMYSNPNKEFDGIREVLKPISTEDLDLEGVKGILLNLYNYLDKFEDENSIITISAGTEFIITGIGESIEYDDIRIIGIYTLFEDNN